MFGLPNVQPADVPDELRIAPRIDQCKKCGKSIIWCRRSDEDEIGSPIEPRSAVDGNLLIVGFTLSLRKGVVVPHIRSVESIQDLPDLSMLPAWAERRRWLHHGPFCKLLLRTDDTPPRTIDNDPELSAAYYKRLQQASRQKFVGGFLQRVVLKLPHWTPSESLSHAFTDYELGKINSHQLKAAITYEPGLVGDFLTTERNIRHKRIYRRRV
jgi:hypothetical protein